MRIIFFGSGAFAVTSLEAIISSNHDIVLVCTRPPQKGGRRRTSRSTYVDKFAVERSLQVRRPEKPSDPSLIEEIQKLEPDIGVLADYARLLPLSILNVPRLGFLNVHPSLLPRWRGAAPIQRAIIADDEVTGVSIMQMNEKLDQGPVLIQQQVKIMPQDTFETMAIQLADIGAKMIVDALSKCELLKPLAINHSISNYAHKINKEESKINWLLPSERVDCLIRGLSPFPGAWSEFGGERIKILLSIRENGDGKPGELIDDKLQVACGQGSIRILRLQRSGKSPMNSDEFLRGFKIRKADTFS